MWYKSIIKKENSRFLFKYQQRGFRKVQILALLIFYYLQGGVKGNLRVKSWVGWKGGGILNTWASVKLKRVEESRTNKINTLPLSWRCRKLLNWSIVSISYGQFDWVQAKKCYVGGVIFWDALHYLISCMNLNISKAYKINRNAYFVDRFKERNY